MARNGGYRAAVILLRRGRSPADVEAWLMKTHCISDSACARRVVEAAILGAQAADALAENGVTLDALQVPDIGGRI